MVILPPDCGKTAAVRAIVSPKQTGPGNGPKFRFAGGATLTFRLGKLVFLHPS